MIIYNKTWLNNLMAHELVSDEENGGYITRAESNAIKQKYPVGFYLPGIFIRVGLFILTCVITLCVMGLLSLMLESSQVLDSFGWPLFFLFGPMLFQ
jgi:hypothetical protein